LTGGRPPRYIQSGGIDALNAQKSEQKRDMALSEVLRHLEETRRRLLDCLHSVPEEHFTRETRFRHRLRLDSYSHYPMHARAIREWRGRPAGKGGGERGGAGAGPSSHIFFGGTIAGLPRRNSPFYGVFAAGLLAWSPL